MRREEDTLGPRELPETALHGIGTARCVETLSFSGRRLAAYPRCVAALAAVKTAAARANRRAGVLDETRCAAIVHAASELAAGAYDEHLVVDVFAGGGSIAINVNCNEVLANAANLRFGRAPGSSDPVHPKTHVNASQSTADVCHTAHNVALIRHWELVDAALARLAGTAAGQARRLADVVITARTCLQDALPVTLGAVFGAYESLLRRRRGELGEAVARLRLVSLGGTVIGSGEGAPPAYRSVVVGELCTATGLDLAPAPDLYDAAQHIDPLVAVSASLATLAGALIKMAKDLRLMASGPGAGFGELTLPATQEGSSFFAGKINPVVPETLIQACFLVLGADRVVQAAAEHGELNLNVFEGAAAFAAMEALELLARALAGFDAACFGGIEPGPRSLVK